MSNYFDLLFTFQQDNAQAHPARETVDLLSRSTPDFIVPLMWSPNSPDLNPVDNEVWGVLQQHVYQSRIHKVELKDRLIIEEWHCFPQRALTKPSRNARSIEGVCS